jgi:hypothetical protein
MRINLTKLLIFMLLLTFSADSYAKLGQSQFLVEKEIRRKFLESRVMNTISNETVERSIRLTNMEYKVVFRGTPVIPDSINYLYKSDERIDKNPFGPSYLVNDLDFKYRNFTSVEESITFTKEVPFEKAVNYAKKLLPDNVEFKGEFTDGECSFRVFNKIYQIKLDYFDSSEPNYNPFAKTKQVPPNEGSNNLVSKIIVMRSPKELNNAMAKKKAALISELKRRIEIADRNGYR